MEEHGFAPPAFKPQPPRSLEQLEIPHGLVLDLVLRRAHMEGACTFSSLCTALKLSNGIVEAAFRQLQKRHLAEMRGLVGEDYSFSLTTEGQRLAVARRRISHYAGPAPVSLREYVEAVRLQAAKLKVTRALLEEAFNDLVVTEDLTRQIGPALASQRSLFLYGPTGNGKTSLAERLHRVYRDTVMIPYAVNVDGQILLLYDPVVHEKVDCANDLLDQRWVPCQRPFLVAGGEMTPGMLDLRLDPATQIYAAPLQMKANNGILLIDDFGRQAMSPRKLLNRWILPLDRRVDYLSLSYGVKFQIPFELMVVFSTNLDPVKLADEAFLRRIPSKVYVGPVTAEVFDRIYCRFLTERGITYDPDSAQYLRGLCREAGATYLMACYPRDICTLAEWICDFEERPMEITKSNLERAVALYFTRTVETPAGAEEISA
jgi:predicted ATPase with chaperone activity